MIKGILEAIILGMYKDPEGNLTDEQKLNRVAAVIFLGFWGLLILGIIGLFILAALNR